MRSRKRLAARIAVVVSVIALILPAHGNASPKNSFDLETGNAALEVIVPTAQPPVLSTVGSGDASIILHISTIMSISWYDAIAPYHPTAAGIFSRVARRPASERETHRQRNIAMLHASYQVLKAVLPQFDTQWRGMLTLVGLDPDDASRDQTTPVGIGNTAGDAVLAARVHDGMNLLGDEGGRKYNRKPYADYTGYQPVNTADTLRDPSRWQPNVVTSGNGIFRVQKFVTPQYGITKPFSYGSPSEFKVPPPRNSDPVRNPAGYKRQTDQVLQASASLTDRRKLTAEYFDDKFRALFGSAAELAIARQFTLDQFIFIELVTNIAAFDAGIATWHFKRKYDAVRPFSAIRHLYGGQQLTAWGGPGMGTVSDITGGEWRSYLNTADHPEYPSGSASFCAAHAQAARRFTGDDTLNQSVTIAEGASVVEPGVTPREDTVIGPWHTWTEWEKECALSRVWGGVHFKDAVITGHALGRPIGDRAYEFLDAHIRGEPVK